MSAIASIVIKFVAKYWYIILAAVVIIGGVLYVRNLQNTVEEQRMTIASMQVQLDDCNKIKDQYAAAINSLNEQVKQWEQVSNEQKKKFDTLQGSIAKINQQYNKRIQQLLARPKPKTCDESIKFLIEAGRENTWSKQPPQ